MKIIGGTFGVEGSAYITRDGQLVVEGAKTGRFKGSEIVALSARTQKEKKFGCFSFLLGAVILSIIFGIFLNVIGVVIGIVLAAAGSFYSNSTNLVDLSFISAETVTLECTPRQVKKLVQLKR